MHTTIDKKSKNTSFLSGLVGGTLSLTLSAIIVKVIGLIYKIPISLMLGDEGMGYFNSAYTVFGFFYLLCTAGVPKAVMILLSRAKVGQRKDEEDKILRVAVRLFASVGFGATVLFFLFSAPLSALIGNRRALPTMLAVAPSIFFVSVSGVIRGYLSANSHLSDIALSQVFEGVGKLVLGLVFAMVGVRLKLSVDMLSALTILGVSCGSILGFTYLLICSKNKIKKEKTGQKVKNIDKNHFRLIVKSILKISVPITVSAAIMSITNIIDLGLIMRSLVTVGYTEGEASALYGNYTTLAVPMLNLAMSVISPITMVFLPIFTRLISSQESGGLRRVEKSAINLTAILCAPIMIGLFVYSREILMMLFKNSEIRVGAMLLCLICPAILFSSLLLIVNTLLEAGGMVKAPLISMLIGSIAKIIVSLYIITRTDMGIAGAPIGTVVSYATALTVSIIMYGRYYKKHIPLFECCLLPHLNALVAIMLSRFVYDRVQGTMYSSSALLLSICLAALIYLAISVATGELRSKKIAEIAKYTNLSS